MEIGKLKVLIRGAGEMATGVAVRLAGSGLAVVMTEIEAPLAVRRAVSFCEALWDGSCIVEGIAAVKVSSPDEFDAAISAGHVPVLVDPELGCLADWNPAVLIDATVAKTNRGISPGMAPLVIALGPGFEAPVDAHVVVETCRGHDLGRLIYEGRALPDTGVPEPVSGYSAERVLRAPGDGVLNCLRDIGDMVKIGDLVAEVGGMEVRASIPGVLRGLMRKGSPVRQGMKIGDVDPRYDRRLCFTVSDKARALGGSVLEAIMGRFNR